MLLSVMVTVWPSSTAVVVPLTVRGVAASALYSATLSSPLPAKVPTARVGAKVSMLMARVPGSEVLPAASVAVADRVSASCPMAAMSAGTSV